MLKLNLVKRIENDEKVAYFYENEYYKVIKTVYRCEFDNLAFAIQPKQNDYMPEISYRYNLDFYIQTTSYGSLESNEIKKIIQGYQLALATIEELKKLV